MFIIFVSQDNKDPLIYTMPEVVYARDLSLSVRKDYSDCSTALELVQKELAQEEGADEEEHLLVSQLRVRKEEGRTRKVYCSSRNCRPKGKGC